MGKNWIWILFFFISSFIINLSNIILYFFIRGCTKCKSKEWEEKIKDTFTKKPIGNLQIQVVDFIKDENLEAIKEFSKERDELEKDLFK